ncbi:hypothetical protein GCM10009129_14000 [Psychrobacter aestuarii]|uniref:Uncharacterized protein n=1 Tax=Psychrobacter aestuarii TaxID=556327 RepID=A0ABN0VUN8_9GAMM
MTVPSIRADKRFDNMGIKKSSIKNTNEDNYAKDTALGQCNYCECPYAFGKAPSRA